MSRKKKQNIKQRSNQPVHKVHLTKQQLKSKEEEEDASSRILESYIGHVGRVVMIAPTPILW